MLSYSRVLYVLPEVEMTLIFPIIENINTNSKSVSKLNIQCVISEYFVDDEKYQIANAL